MKALQEIYIIKNPSIPDYYLGANYVGNVESNWYITAKQYILESIKHIEILHYERRERQWQLRIILKRIVVPY
jgi:hypothetical protein